MVRSRIDNQGNNHQFDQIEILSHGISSMYLYYTQNDQKIQHPDYKLLKMHSILFHGKEFLQAVGELIDIRQEAIHFP